MTSVSQIDIAGGTHVGARRVQNEDALGWNHWNAWGQARAQSEHSMQWPVADALVAVLADGMGGHRAGEVASQRVIEAMTQADWISSLQADPLQTLAARIGQVHQQIDQEALDRLECFGMGSTVAGLVLTAEYVTVFNVGDSRVYLLNEQGLQQLSVDDRPQGGPDNVLTQAMGGATVPQPHIVQRPLLVGDRYLICSDGLTGELADDEIADLLSPPEQAVERLLESALGRGGRDNITVLTVSLN